MIQILFKPIKNSRKQLNTQKQNSRKQKFKEHLFILIFNKLATWYGQVRFS